MHLVTHSTLLKALGWSLLDSLWQMAVLWLLFILFTRIFKGITAHARHNLAVFLLGIGTVWTGFSFSAIWSAPDLESGVYKPFGSLIPAQGAAIHFIETYLPYCSILYLAVLVFFVVRYTNIFVQSLRLKNTGLSRIKGELSLFAKDTAYRMGIQREVRIWLSKLVDGPVTLGFLKPVILLPIASLNNLSIQQAEAILLHELAHIKRHDYLLNLVLSFLEMIFFFNPFVILLMKDIKREREHRCDDLVLQFQYEPQEYIAALLTLARQVQAPGMQLAMAASGENNHLLLRRVRRILKQAQPAEKHSVKSAGLLLLPLIIYALTFFRPTTEPVINSTDALAGTGGTIAVAAPILSIASFSAIEYPVTIKNAPSSSATLPSSAPLPSSATLPTSLTLSNAVTARTSTRSAQKNIDAPAHPPLVQNKKSDDLVQNLKNEGIPPQVLVNQVNEPVQFVNISSPEERDFSINSSQDMAGAPQTIVINRAGPFISKTSFMFRDKSKDTLLTRLAMVRQQAIQEILLSMARLQQEFRVKWQQLQSAAIEKVWQNKEDAWSAQQQLLMAQKQLQWEFLKKQAQLKIRVEKLRSPRLIIVI